MMVDRDTGIYELNRGLFLHYLKLFYYSILGLMGLGCFYIYTVMLLDKYKNNDEYPDEKKQKKELELI